MAKEPSQSDVWHILQETPNTIFLTVTKKGCAKINAFAVESLFPNQTPIAVLPNDPESNVDNYDGSSDARSVPLMMKVFEGARVILTKNLNKQIGFVNGMSGTVLGMNGDNVIVRTEQNVRISVHAWTDPVTGIVHYPFRLGYASTLHKVQGATLPHITLWLDSKKPMPAAGYVALSRVTHDAHWQYVGDPSVHDFEAAHF